ASVQLQNAMPVATDDNAVTDGTAVAISVLDNDTDADVGDTLTITGITDPAAGSIALQGGSITYTPGLAFFGVDSFSYSVSDGHGGTATATVHVQSSGLITRVMAATGTPVPGATGMVFNSIQVPAIGDDALVTFLADATGPGGKTT